MSPAENPDFILTGREFSNTRPGAGRSHVATHPSEAKNAKLSTLLRHAGASDAQMGHDRRTSAVILTANETGKGSIVMAANPNIECSICFSNPAHCQSGLLAVNRQT